MRRRVLLALVGAAAAWAQSADPQVDRMIARERNLLKSLEAFDPVVETYIQESVNGALSGDHYYLGKVDLGHGFRFTPLIASESGRARKGVMRFDPAGFAQTITPDPVAWNRETYAFENVRAEFLGDVRCLVYDVSPRDKAPSRFTGRIWVEDRDSTIVRFNGTYSAAAEGHRYAHFDSWRVRSAQGLWIPAYMYVEETGGRGSIHGQTRFWGYQVGRGGGQNELASIQVRTPAGVKDSSEAQDASPIESQREWQRQAEDNILSRLERAGLLAPAGEVDGILNTVVTNLIVTNNLAIAPEVRCRVLLTTPLEIFSVGNTIVISRGLLDVLPDEATLAMALATELAQVALGNTRITRFAFQDLTMFPDNEVMRRFHFQRTAEQLRAGDARALEILAKSPYKETGSMGLFLRTLAGRMRQLPNLMTARLGDGLTAGDSVRLAELISSAKPAEIEALPLGGRIKLDPWNGSVKLTKSRPVAILSGRDRIPFEVTPFKLHLTQ